MFPSRIFMVSQLIFKSFIHFEFILVYGVSWWSSFIFCIYQSSSPNTICWRGCLYSIVCSCLLFQILIDHKGMGLFLALSSVPLIYVCFYASTMLFLLLWPCSIVWCHEAWYLRLCSSFSRGLRLYRVFCGSIYIFGISVLVLYIRHWCLDRNCSESIDCFG